jgi:peptidyl-prolyl cis-trans isomerase C
VTHVRIPFLDESDWLREPLLHFILLGIVLFLIGRMAGSDARERLSRIDITPDDIRQLRVAWVAQWQREPSDDELRGLIEARVREEILYREALALGLDRGDTIVKRRLAQKMEFLADDVSNLPEPTTTQLRTWFEQHARQFALPARLSFHHLYFSNDRGPDAARAAAVAALGTLAGADEGAAATAATGDRFMFLDHYSDRTADQVASLFGSAFAAEVFALRPDPAWQGPIESGFGWHLVQVDAFTPERVPAFEEVEPSVKQAWIANERDEVKRRAFDAMKARYQIVVAQSPGAR